MIRVCSGFSESGYKEYGKRFLETFHKHWPQTVDLMVFTEADVEMPRGSCRSLWDCRGAAQFLVRHKDNPERCGTKQHAKWKPKYIGRPYNFRFDACKFFKQCLIPQAAAHDMTDGDILVWLDADVVTFTDVPEGMVEGVLGDRDIVFLGRQGTHSEIGFWAVRINHRTREFLALFADTWRSDKVFELEEWHSAFVFDWCRRHTGLKENNLTPDGRGHVFAASCLQEWMDHCKGEARKKMGYSPERKFGT